MKTSIGICAHNEEKNIGKLITRLLTDPLINEIIVVASGCTDNTVKIAEKFPVKLIVDPERRGKAVAVNQFIDQATGDILIIESADTLPVSFTFKRLLQPFTFDSVGMVGAHPIPTNNDKSMMSKIGRLLWKTHHEMARKSPKAGEVCAFRNVIQGIDPQTAVDEACIESQVVKQGYKIYYQPHAIIFNKTPLTYDDFLKQRSRIFHGHLLLKESGYEVPSMSVLTAAISVLKAADYRHLKTLGTAVIYETMARRQAIKRLKYKGSSTIWETVDSTKDIS